MDNSGLVSSHEFALVEASVNALIDSGLSGRPVAHASDVGVVLAALGKDKSSWSAAQRAGYSAAATRSLLYAGHALQAVSVVDEARQFVREAAEEADPQYLAKCLSLLGEACLLTGRARDCAEFARIALDDLVRAPDPAVLFRVQGLLAAALAVNGEFDESERLCEQTQAGVSESVGAVLPWSLLLARTFIARRRGDSQSIRAMLESSYVPSRVTLMQDGTRAIARGWLASMSGDPRGAIAEMQIFVRGVLAQRFPPLFIAHALALEAMAFVELGQPGDAMRALVGRPTLPDHTVCFDLVRASIHIRQGQPRLALRVTERCLRCGPTHSLRTLPSVHVRRAVAMEMIGLREAADQEFSQACHLSAGLGGLSPALGVRRGPLDSLLGRLLVNEPEFGRLVIERIAPIRGNPEPKPLAFPPVELTDRERGLAGWLGTELTLPQIAEKQFVSINTVKTHLRNLYKKLGVTSREDAVAHLMGLGLLDDPRDH